MSWPTTPWAMVLADIHDNFMQSDPTELEAIDWLHTAMQLVGLHLSNDSIDPGDAHAELDRYIENFGTDQLPDRRFVVGMIRP